MISLKNNAIKKNFLLLLYMKDLKIIIINDGFWFETTLNKMESMKIIFGDKEIDKKEFYMARDTILLDKVDFNKIIAPNEIIVNNNSKKYVAGYKKDDVIMPLCIELPQIDGYIRYFESGAKKMLVVIKEGDKDVYTRYSKIWKKIASIMKVKFSTSPIYDDKFIGARLKTFGEQNNTVFTDNNNIVVKMPKENVRYSSIPIIDVDSVHKVDISIDYKAAKVYPQIYLRQCKYLLYIPRSSQ